MTWSLYASASHFKLSMWKHTNTPTLHGPLGHLLGVTVRVSDDKLLLDEQCTMSSYGLTIWVQAIISSWQPVRYSISWDEAESKKDQEEKYKVRLRGTRKWRTPLFTCLKGWNLFVLTAASRFALYSWIHSAIACLFDSVCIHLCAHIINSWSKGVIFQYLLSRYRTRYTQFFWKDGRTTTIILPVGCCNSGCMTNPGREATNASFVELTVRSST